MSAPSVRDEIAAGRAHYQEHGWARFAGVFVSAEARRLAEYATTLASTQMRDPADRTRTDVGADGTTAPRKLLYPSLRDPRFLRLAMDVRLRNLIIAMAGGMPMLLMDHVFLKPAKIGGAKYPHQDDFYLRVDPPECALTTWVALDDADEGNGCLQYWSGSHRDGLMAHGFPADEPRNARLEDPAPGEPVPVPVRRGDVIVHHLHCIHESGTNRSERPRRAYSMHWLTGDAQVAPRQLAQANFRDPAYPQRSALRQRFPALFA